MNSFQSIIRYIQSTDPVSPEVINTPLQQLQNSIHYLKQIIDLENLGQQLILYEQPVDAETSENDVVYFDKTSLTFKRAKPKATAVDGVINIGNTALITGIVLRKTSPILADLLIWGIAEINLADAVQVGETPRECAIYYLSQIQPGKVTANLPHIPIAVGTSLRKISDTKYLFNFTPSVFTAQFAHKHLAFDLKCTLASDNTEEGWLASNDEIFGGKAPAAAKYGYNIARSPLKNYWPPAPIESAFLLWYTGEDTVPLLCGVPHGNENDYVIINEYGLWWLTDCGREPWMLGSDTVQTSESCPIARRRLILYLSNPVTNTNASVTSLKTKDSTGLIAISAETGTPQITGHLLLDLNADYFEEHEDNTLEQAIKYDKTENRLVTGTVVSSLTSQSNALVLKKDGTTIPTGTAGSGNLTLSLDTTKMIGDLPCQVIRLVNIVEGIQQNFICLIFLFGRASELTGKINVPYREDYPGLFQVKLRFWISGTSPGNPSQALQLSAAVVGQPSTTLPIPLNPVLSQINWTQTSQNISFSEAGQHIILESEPLNVMPGNLILFKLARQQSDSYNGDLMLIQESARPV